MSQPLLYQGSEYILTSVSCSLSFVINNIKNLYFHDFKRHYFKNANCRPKFEKHTSYLGYEVCDTEEKRR